MFYFFSFSDIEMPFTRKEKAFKHKTYNFELFLHKNLQSFKLQLVKLLDFKMI